eukprot:SAG11_NODE_12318_length_709_cov_0.983607_1_plen_78_part_00
MNRSIRFLGLLVSSVPTSDNPDGLVKGVSDIKFDQTDGSDATQKFRGSVHLRDAATAVYEYSGYEYYRYRLTGGALT